MLGGQEGQSHPSALEPVALNSPVHQQESGSGRRGEPGHRPLTRCWPRPTHHQCPPLAPHHLPVTPPRVGTPLCILDVTPDSIPYSILPTWPRVLGGGAQQDPPTPCLPIMGWGPSPFPPSSKDPRAAVGSRYVPPPTPTSPTLTQRYASPFINNIKYTSCFLLFSLNRLF